MFKIVHNTDEWSGTVSARGFYGEILIFKEKHLQNITLIP